MSTAAPNTGTVVSDHLPHTGLLLRAMLLCITKLSPGERLDLLEMTNIRDEMSKLGVETLNATWSRYYNLFDKILNGVTLELNFAMVILARRVIDIAQDMLIKGDFDEDTTINFICSFVPQCFDIGAAEYCGTSHDATAFEKRNRAGVLYFKNRHPFDLTGDSNILKLMAIIELKKTMKNIMAARAAVVR